MDLAITRKKVDIPARCPYDLTGLQLVNSILIKIGRTRISERESLRNKQYLKGNVIREYYICIRSHLLRSVTTRCNLDVSIASLRCGIIVIPGTVFMLDAVTKEQNKIIRYG